MTFNISNIKPRSTQTIVKHTILERYLHAWAGIILNGQRQRAATLGNSFDLHYVYVDCNAHTGRYAGDQGSDDAAARSAPVFGSPIIGINALDAFVAYAISQGVTVRRNAILIERDRTYLAELHRSLEMANLHTRVQETARFHHLADGQIAVVHADSTALAPQLNHYTQQGYTFTLFFLDPYGPTGIPLDFVREIVCQKRHDVIINMPYQDLHKKMGSVAKATLLPVERELVKNFDAMFGHTRWQQLVGLNTTDLELELTQCYKETLQSVDNTLSVKSIALRFPDKERTMFYLYLTTHDPNGALHMNKVLWDAQYQEHELRWHLRQSRRQQRVGMVDMFAEQVPDVVRPERATKEDIGQHICQELAGKRITRRDLYRVFADEPYFDTEINQALTHLRKQRKVDYTSSLKNDTLITIR